MRCHEIQELLSAYFDGMLDPSAKNAVDLHLKGCAACRTDLEDLSFVVGLVRDLPPVEPPVEFRESVRARVQAFRHVETRGFLKKIALGRWSRVVAVAASFLLVIGIASAWSDFLPFAGLKDKMQVGSIVVKENNEAQKLGADNKDNFEVLKDNEKILSTYYDMSQADITQKKAVGSEGTTGAVRNSAPVDIKIVMPDDLSAAALPPRDSGEALGKVSARGFAPEIMAAPSMQESAPEKSFIEIKVDDSSAAIKKISDIALLNRGSAEVLPENAGRELTVTVPDSQYKIVMAEIRKTGRIITEGSPQLKKAGAPPGAGERTVTPTSLADGKGGAGEDNNKVPDMGVMKAEGNGAENKETMAVIRITLSD